MKLITIAPLFAMLPVAYLYRGYVKSFFTKKHHKQHYSNFPYIPNASIPSNLADEKSHIMDNFDEDTRIVTSLISLFEKDQPFLNNSIRIEDVALMLSSTRIILSKVLNKRLSRNFNQFVNYYRIREVCRRYVADPSQHIYVICQQCGFKTTTSFCNSFRNNTGYSPVLWCKEVNNKIENNENVNIDEYLS